MKAESVTLFFREAGSDKTYQAQLEAKDAGWVVNFQYGRRGGELKAGSKTTAPIAFEKAKKVYDALVAEKVAKGYSPGEAGVRYAGTELAGRATMHRPQLLNPVDEGDVETLLAGSDWWMQEKLDGKRILLEKKGSTVTAINRRGLATAIPDAIMREAARIDGDVVLDGELVGETYWVFDRADMPLATYEQRWDNLHDVLVLGDGPIQKVGAARTEREKRALLARIRTEGGEGVVFKRRESHYTPGRPASGGPQLKLKFQATASCLVVGVNEGKRSIRLGLTRFEDSGPDSTVEVGSVTIPPNHAVPTGGIAEVRYLYAHRGGSLFQPVYLGQRDDLERSACNLSQLKYKAEYDDEAGQGDGGN